MMVSNVEEEVVKVGQVMSRSATCAHQERGNIRAIENFARFYLDRIITVESLDTVVVYLDADTIVLGDIAEVGVLDSPVRVDF